MNWEDIFKIIIAALGSIGIGGGIIFALSSWLGKLWAARILENEKNEFREELEKTKRELDIYKETVLRVQSDKLFTYRAAFDVVAKVLAALDSFEAGRLHQTDAGKLFDQFNQQRLQLYGYLGMLAPQSVMDAQDELMDYILKISNGSVPYEWEQVRKSGTIFINEVRKDIGIDPSPITYRGGL